MLEAKLVELFPDELQGGDEAREDQSLMAPLGQRKQAFRQIGNLDALLGEGRQKQAGVDADLAEAGKGGQNRDAVPSFPAQFPAGLG